MHARGIVLLFANTGLQLLTSQPLVTNPVGTLVTPRGTGIPTIVQFAQNGAIYDPETFVTSIASIPVSNPGQITTTQPHNIPNGATVAIAGVTGAVPLSSINASVVATVTSPTSFTIPVAVTTAAAPNTGTVTVVVPVLPRWTVKSKGQYNQDPPAAIIPAGSFTKTGSGNTTTFTGSCNYVTDQINADLGIVAPVTLTATISEASPGVVTTAAQTFVAGMTAVFETTGVLPAPLQPGIEYYITATSLTSLTFTVALTPTGAAINTTTAGSGVHTVIVTSETASVASASYLAELSWGGVFPSKAQVVNLTVLNDLFKGGETPPLYTGGANGIAAIGNGNAYVTVAFPYTLASVSYSFTRLAIINTTDPTPENLFPGTITAMSATGFTIQISGITDSANYSLQWGVAMN